MATLAGDVVVLAMRVLSPFDDSGFREPCLIGPPFPHVGNRQL
jgi:hypothetical protein